MPWSAWIQSPEEESTRSPVRSAATGSPGESVQMPSPGDAEAQISEAISDVTAGLDAITEMTSGVVDAEAQQGWAPFNVGGVDSVAQAQAIWAIHWYGFSDDATRQMFPPELDGLEYGVDYGPRPDRDETSDVDAYIEYEDGLILLQAADVQGWAGEVVLTSLGASKDGTVFGTASGRASLRGDLPRPADLPPTILTSPTLPGFGGGTTIATVTGPADTTGGGTFSMSAGEMDFAVVVEPDFTFPHDEGLYNSAIRDTRNITVRLLYPRWRYWIPREPYVRLLHRGDGLGLSSNRLRQRGQTNQAGRLRGGY